jgi:hypothetical protein
VNQPARLPVPPSHRVLPAVAGIAVLALALASPAAAAKPREAAPRGAPPAHGLKAAPARHGPLADFGGTAVSPSVREVANWAFFTGDNHGRAVVILDKKEATVYAFDPRGRLFATAPALIGITVGDDTVPGVGDKPLADVRDDEKTTPAGRFVAQPGEDDDGVDVVWIDYDAAVAMHRVINKVPAERRPERLASPDPQERRISFGCINLPIPFYEQVLSPTVRRTGAVVYVLPETKPVDEVFGSWDVTDPAARPPALAARPSRSPQSGGLHPPKALRDAQALRTSAAAAAL